MLRKVNTLFAPFLIANLASARVPRQPSFAIIRMRMLHLTALKVEPCISSLEVAGSAGQCITMLMAFW